MHKWHSLPPFENEAGSIINETACHRKRTSARALFQLEKSEFIHNRSSQQRLSVDRKVREGCRLTVALLHLVSATGASSQHCHPAPTRYCGTSLICSGHCPRFVDAASAAPPSFLFSIPHNHGRPYKDHVWPRTLLAQAAEPDILITSASVPRFTLRLGPCRACRFRRVSE